MGGASWAGQGRKTRLHGQGPLHVWRMASPGTGAGRWLDEKSRMTGDCHVRFRGSAGGRFPRATRRVRHFLRRRMKIDGRGTAKFSEERVFGELEVLSVQKLPRKSYAHAL
jgi:hypothetical protein